MVDFGSIVATRASTNECHFIGPLITAEPDPVGMFTNLLGSIEFPTYTRGVGIPAYGAMRANTGSVGLAV